MVYQILFIIIIILIVRSQNRKKNRKRRVPSTNNTPPPPPKPPKTFYESWERSYDFRNRFIVPDEDYSELTLSQAKSRLKRLKDRGDYSSDKYYALLNRIHQSKDEARIKLIEDLEIDVLRENFKAFYQRTQDSDDDHITTDVMYAFFYRLSENDEPILLEQLKILEPKQIPNWISEKKQEAYFFSEMVYSEAYKKYMNL